MIRLYIHVRREGKMATRNAFFRDYIKAIRDGNAALFAGAGLSRPSGFVDWKELLRPLAEDIGLKIDDEHDLTLVAQYVRNKSGNRNSINQSIMDAFNREVDLNDNVRVFNSPNGVFCSAAYYSEKQGKVIPSTVTRNGKFKSVTVAMADGGKKVSAKELVQELWGNEAGGHPGIAGSPRGQEMTEKDMQQLAKVVNERYNKINEMNEPIYFEPDEVSLDD